MADETVSIKRTKRCGNCTWFGGESRKPTTQHRMALRDSHSTPADVWQTRHQHALRSTTFSR